MRVKHNEKINRLLLSMLSHNITMKEAVEICYGEGTFNSSNTSRFNRFILPKLEEYGFVMRKKGIYKPNKKGKRVREDYNRFNKKEIALYIDKELFKSFILVEIDEILEKIIKEKNEKEVIIKSFDFKNIEETLLENEKEIITKSFGNFKELIKIIRKQIRKFNLNAEFMLLILVYLEIDITEAINDSNLRKYSNNKQLKELLNKICLAIDFYNKSQQTARRFFENLEKTYDSDLTKLIFVPPEERKKGGKLLKGKYKRVPANNKEMIFVKNV